MSTPNTTNGNILNKNLLDLIAKSDVLFFDTDQSLYNIPSYDAKNHYVELTKSKYFKALLHVRHHLHMTSDYWFGTLLGALKVDLFMLTPSISSPMGLGSDSEGIPIKFGDLNSYLVDSSQFGFEPLLMNDTDKVYCYLPSMRGENPDKRHLNQFFHCEAEIKGTLEELIPLVEGYIKSLSEALLGMPNIIDCISLNSAQSKTSLEEILNTTMFDRITFDEACEILVKNNKENLIRVTKHGRDITSKGEIELFTLLGKTTPLWVTHYDRDRVAFYQKPDSKNSNKVLNADLLFPSLIQGSFGGEIVGCGQRQDSTDEMYESLKRQAISSESYEWYIRLRKLPNYSTTSGFGLGLERFITWALCRDDIKDSTIYPRLKNVVTYP